MSEAAEPEQDASIADTRRWLRDMGALLALPALWVDHEPPEIATGLMSVLAGVLELDAVYARFDSPDGSNPLEGWRPSAPYPPADLQSTIDTPAGPGTGITSSTVAMGASGATGTSRVVRVPLALPWGTGLVVVSARRDDFPTAIEVHLLRVAVSQGAIAIHTARRLARERAVRTEAETLLRRQNELLRALADEVEPSLASITRHLHNASRLVAEVDAAPAHTPGRVSPAAATGPAARAVSPANGTAAVSPLTRREIEVLGLLAQGLSNKEIAGVMRLSDRTVERHITSVYRKIGVARRSEATAFALRHGLG